MKKVTVLGGSGFVGSSLVARLDDEGYQVTVLARRREQAKHLILLPNVQVVECDVHNAQQLKPLLDGADIVVNLVGVLHQTARASFEKVHHQLPKKLAQICDELGIKRLIHMSALKASKDAPSAYLRSKAAGEEALSAYNKKLNITIFQPSIVFGRHDNFFNMFAGLVTALPVIFLAKPNAKFQPIWVEDVTTSFVNALNNRVTYGKTIELGGPQIYTLRGLIEKAMSITGKDRKVIELGDTLSYFQASIMEFMPIKLMSRDNIKSMEVDNVLSQPLAVEEKLRLMPVGAIVPEYLVDDHIRGAYDGFRTAAGRAISAKR